MDLDVVTKGKGDKGKRETKCKGKTRGKGNEVDRDYGAGIGASLAIWNEIVGARRRARGLALAPRAEKGNKGGKAKNKEGKKGEMKSMEEESSELAGKLSVRTGLLMTLDEERDLGG